MKKKMPQVISPRKFNFVLGLLISLISLVLILNVGVAARGANLPFIYLFGVGQLILFLFIYYLGMCLLIKGKIYLIKNAFVIIGSIVIFVSLTMLFTAIVFINNPSLTIGNDFFNQYQNIYSDLSKYFSIKILPYFSLELPIGGGLIGYSLYAIFCIAGGKSLGLAMTIIFMVIGALLAFEPLEAMLFKKIKNYKTNNKKEKVEKPLQYRLSRKEKNDFFKRAATLDDGDYADIKAIEQPKGGMMSPDFDERDKFIEFTNTSQNSETFTKPSFDRDETGVYSGDKFNKEVESVVFESRNQVEEPVSNINKPDNENIEQMSLDFNNDSEVEDEINDIPETQVPTFEQEKVFEEKPAPQVNVAHTPRVLSQEVKPAPIPEPVIEEKKEEPFVWVPPSYDLLDEYPGASTMEDNQFAAEERQRMINEIFSNFGVGAQCIGFTIGSSVTRYHIQYNNNVSSAKVASMVQDISIRLGGLPARFEGVIEGEFYSGLEIANPSSCMVSFKEVVMALPDVNKHPTAVGFGKNISGKVVAADFAEFPHLLVSGTTGSGKSIYVHSVISTLIMRMSPKDLKIVLVDPKRVEMTKYRDMPHLLCPIITDAEKATVMMNKLAEEMNDRYSHFEEADSCSDIKQYNAWAEENNKPKLPYILAVLDEYADLVDSCKDISKPVVSIAQKARAAGIHLLIATQRPSTNVITGTIKANLATRVALMTANYVDSMTIIGEGGAEKLLGKGDMLVQSALVSRVGTIRLQGCFVNNKEINRVVSYLKDHYKPEYDPKFMDLVDHSKEAGQAYVASGEIMEGIEDEEEAAYQSIKEWTMCQVSVSISKIQRECGVGFSRAGRFFIRMQKEGIVSFEKDPVTKGCFVLKVDKFSEAGRPVSSEEQSSIGNDEDN